jgi:hypothetical protein
MTPDCECRCECDAFTGISHFSHPHAPCEFVRFAPFRTIRTFTKLAARASNKRLTGGGGYRSNL